MIFAHTLCFLLTLNIQREHFTKCEFTFSAHTMKYLLTLCIRAHAIVVTVGYCVQNFARPSGPSRA